MVEMFSLPNPRVGSLAKGWRRRKRIPVQVQAPL